VDLSLDLSSKTMDDRLVAVSEKPKTRNGHLEKPSKLVRRPSEEFRNQAAYQTVRMSVWNSRSKLSHFPSAQQEVQPGDHGVSVLSPACQSGA